MVNHSTAPMAIGAVEWLTMARIVRGQVIGLKNQEFVMAAKAMGVSNVSMFRKHLLPNILGLKYLEVNAS